MSTSSPKLSSLRRLRIAGETTYNTAGANFDAVQTRAIELGLERAAIEDAHQKQDLYEVERILGLRSGTITTRHHLHGWSSTVPVAAPSHATGDAAGATGFDQLWGAIAAAFGQQATGGYTADETASTTAILKATTMDSFVAGQAVGWNTSANGYQVGWIKDMTNGVPDQGTLQQTAVAVPSGNKLYGSYTAAMKEGVAYLDGTPKSFTLEVAAHDGDTVTATGCQPTGLKMAFPVGEAPTLEITWGVGNWSEAGGSAPAVISWPFPAPEAIGAGRVVWGASQATTQPIVGLEFDLGLDVAPLRDYNGTNAMGGWHVRAIKPRVTYTVLRDFSKEPTDYNALTGRVFSAVFGSQPGKMFALLVPSALIDSYPKWEEEEGRISSKVTLYPNRYTGDTEGSSPVADTNCRFAFV